MRSMMLLLVLSVMACAQTPKVPMSVEQVLTLRSVVQAEVSPDGTQVAVVLMVPRSLVESDGGAWRNLLLVPSAGGEAKVLVGGAAAVAAPVWSVDGKAVYVLGRMPQEKSVRVWRIAVDGTETKAVSPEGMLPSAFALSPDGGKMALVVTPAESADEKALVASGYNQIVYEENAKCAEGVMVDLGTGAVTAANIVGCVYETAWSPDGKSIWCTVARTPTVDDSYMEKDLWRVDIDFGEKFCVANVPGKFGVFSVSPDGALVAYTAGQDRNDPSTSGLYIVDRAGGTALMLTQKDFNGQVDALCWKDAGTLLACTSFGLDRAILSISVKDGAWGTQSPSGSLQATAISLSANGRVLVSVASSATHPPEAFVQQVGAGADATPKRITDSNASLANTEFGSQIAVEWKARDGLLIQGIVILPVGHIAGQRHPLLVVAHGGPESHYSNAWLTRYSDPGQVGAAQGYVCFYPNYRGSTGRGSAFSRMDQSDNGGKEFDDILDGIDFLVQQGWVDAEHVGITGGSYGGYFTGWGATRHTKRFKAGVMFVGISNNLSKMGTTDIPNEMLDVHWLKTPWEHRELYLERSPITYARDSQTPLLIMHGKDDPRVSYTQSLELYRWMKVKGTNPVRLVLYPGEGHGNRRRSSQYDYALRMMEWFNVFLKGANEGKTPPMQPTYGELPPAPAAK
ncbi:MAG: S9 family peptidase [Planctomycetes bacterium]|nr:S9 family peptidase [Planctomycetota bacterium]